MTSAGRTVLYVRNACSQAVGGTDTGTRQQIADSAAHPIERIRRRREGLVDDHVATRRIDEHDVGERAADVDGESPVGGHGATPFPVRLVVG